MALQSEHTFPRHSHDHFGIGVISQGAQRSWSLLGQVEAGPGDVIIVNPGEVHDGMPLQGAKLADGLSGPRGAMAGTMYGEELC